jgi:hypothetical protein
MLARVRLARFWRYLLCSIARACLFAPTGYIVAGLCTRQSRFWTFNSTNGMIHYNDTQVWSMRLRVVIPVVKRVNALMCSALPLCRPTSILRLERLQCYLIALPRHLCH